jgi:hypothetical protein
LHDAAERNRRAAVSAGNRRPRVVERDARCILGGQLGLLHIRGHLLDCRRSCGRRRRCELLTELVDFLLLLSELFLLPGKRLLQGLQLLFDGSVVAGGERRGSNERSDERRMRDAEGCVGHNVLLNAEGPSGSRSS